MNIRLVYQRKKHPALLNFLAAMEEIEVRKRWLLAMDPPDWFAQQRLTQDDVNKLPADTKVIVIWHGGNGPATYTVRWHYNLPIAVREGIDVGELTGVGEPPLTQVWLALDQRKVDAS